MYEQKYLKYKSKYLELKNNLDGGLLGMSSTLYKLRFLTEDDFKVLKNKLDTIGQGLYKYETTLKEKAVKDINFINLYKIIRDYQHDTIKPIHDFEIKPPRDEVERNVQRMLISQRDYFKWLHLWFKTWVFDLYQKRFNGSIRSWQNPSEVAPEIFIYDPPAQFSNVQSQQGENIKGQKWNAPPENYYNTGNPYTK
jgi:hypothetical protein